MVARHKYIRKGTLDYTYDPLTVPAPSERDHVWEYRDGAIKNLWLKVTGAGGRIWQFEKIQMKSRQRRRIGDAKLMTLQEARVQALEMARAVEAGSILPTLDDKNAQIERLRITVGECFDEYYRGHASRACRTHKEMSRDVERHWGTLCKTQAAHLTTASVRRWLTELANSKSIHVANKQLQVFRACIRWCQANGIITLTENPLGGIKSLPQPAHTEYLKPNELPRLEAALEPESQDLQDMIWLLLWTGQRKSNVQSMQWRELDLEARTWTIPPHKTKSNREYKIALTPNAMVILQRRSFLMGQPHVFPAVKMSSTGYYYNLGKAWLRIRARARLDHLRVHSLRHTHATWLADSGASAFQIQAALQHCSIKTSQRYVHLATEQVRAKMADVQASIVQRAGLTNWADALEDKFEPVQELSDMETIKQQETAVQVVGYVRKKARPISAVGVDGRGRVLRGYVEKVGVQ